MIEGAQKRVVVAVMGKRLIQEAVEYFRAAHIPEYRFPERAAAALAVLVKRAAFLQTPRSAPVVVTDVDRETAVSIINQLPTGTIPQKALTRILTAYSIPTPAIRLAKALAPQTTSRPSKPV